jgi:hypothetical protein
LDDQLFDGWWILRPIPADRGGKLLECDLQAESLGIIPRIATVQNNTNAESLHFAQPRRCQVSWQIPAPKFARSCNSVALRLGNNNLATIMKNLAARQLFGVAQPFSAVIQCPELLGFSP